MKLSICAITLDRFEISSEIIKDTIAKSGIEDVELLVADNGSQDKRIIEAVSKLPSLSYHRLNSVNEGVGRAFNQLMVRAKGEFIALIGNDIQMQNNWAKDAIRYLEKVPFSGISAIHCVEKLPPISKYGVHVSDKVFGPWIFHKRLLNEIGFFHEGYFPYGLEDTDYNLRSLKYGNLNFLAFLKMHYFEEQHSALDNHDHLPFKSELQHINIILFHFIAPFQILIFFSLSLIIIPVLIKRNNRLIPQYKANLIWQPPKK
jgi:glycosyltransferase involved in cell wall biosynthesis